MPSQNDSSHHHHFYDPTPPMDGVAGHAELETEQIMIRQQNCQNQQSSNSSPPSHLDQQPLLDQDIFEAFKTPEDERN